MTRRFSKYSGKKNYAWPAGPDGMRSGKALSTWKEDVPPEETSLQEDCTSKVAWNLARKFASLSRTVHYVLFLVKAPKTQKIACLLCISGASMHNAEQGKVS